MRSFVALGVGASMVLGALSGCGDDDAPRCITGMVIACPCTGGGEGVQTCLSDGTYGSCECGAPDAGSTGDAGARDAGEAVDAGPPDAGEPDAGPPPLTYAGRVDGVESVFGTHPQSAGSFGLEAGHAICRSIGADHVCDYEEVRIAEARGELAAIPMGVTAWVHRTTPAMVGVTLSQPGPGGRCNDWTFNGNHIADGEYLTFDVAGVPTYHLDLDTYYDGLDTTHTTAGDLQCGGVTRAILCCYPAAE